MMLSPMMLALLLLSGLIAVYSLYASVVGLGLRARWDPHSSSRAQLMRERKTCLLSSLLSLLMVLELLCLGLFINLADRMHGLFTGAMCAAGTLNVNPYGHATLIVMLVGFVLCWLWLVLNHLDARAHDTPLLRLKYLLLVPVSAVLSAQGVLLAIYVARLDPNLLTSCCSTLFGREGKTLAAEVARWPMPVMQSLFWLGLFTTVAVGLLGRRSRRWEGVYGVLSGIMLPLSLAAVISFISIHVYRLPTHHCPFCLLQAEYGYHGYFLYTGLLVGTLSGMGVGVTACVQRYASLQSVVPQVLRNLRRCSVAGYALLAMSTVGPTMISDLNFTG